MNTRSALLLLFFLLVAVPVGAAVYLGTTGLRQEKKLLITRELQLLQGRADDVRDALVRELQEFYRIEQQRHFGDYKRRLVVQRQEGRDDVTMPSPFARNDPNATTLDRFEVGAEGRLQLPWADPDEAPLDLLELVNSDEFGRWLGLREQPTEQGELRQTVPSNVVTWNVDQQTRGSQEVQAVYSPFRFFGDFAVRRVRFGRSRIAQGFRTNAAAIAARFLDPLSPYSIVRRFDPHIATVALRREKGHHDHHHDRDDALAAGDELPRVLYRHVVPPSRDSPPVLLPDGYRLVLNLRASTALATTMDKAQTRLLLILCAVAAMTVAGMLFGWRAWKTESQLAAQQVEFVSAVSHEMRTPLTSIRMYAEMLNEGWVKDDDSAREYFRLIGAESERLARLVNNVLDFSRIEKGKKRVRLERGDPAETIRKAAETLRPTLSMKEIELDIAVPESLPECEFDKDAMTQVVVNLIDNAMKYGCENDPKEIRVETEATDRLVMLRVLDRGPGVPRDERMRIFDSFHRGANARPGGGSGLGLSLVHHYVQAHRGSVMVGERSGGGAVFTCTIPIEPAD
ncbi:MAG: HAMP domain-containing sensor histidine kinase [Planctomycetota bacterium]